VRLVAFARTASDETRLQEFAREGHFDRTGRALFHPVRNFRIGLVSARLVQAASRSSFLVGMTKGG